MKQFQAVTIYSSAECRPGMDAARADGCTALSFEFASKALVDVAKALFHIYDERKEWAELCSLPAGRPSVSRERHAYKGVYLYESVHTDVFSRCVNLAGSMLDP